MRERGYTVSSNMMLTSRALQPHIASNDASSSTRTMLHLSDERQGCDQGRKMRTRILCEYASRHDITGTATWCCTRFSFPSSSEEGATDGASAWHSPPPQ